MFYAMEAFSCFEKNYELGDKIKASDLGPYASNLLADGVISLTPPTNPKKKDKAQSESVPSV